MNLKSILSKDKFKLRTNNIVLRIKKYITWKLFIVTALVFIIFISSTLVIQSLFFGKFYISKKKRDIENGIEKFKISYNRAKSDDKVTELIRDFEESSNAKIVIMDEKGKLKFITKSTSERADAGRIKIINDIIRKWTINSDLLFQMKKDNRPLTIVTEKRNNEIRYILSAIPNNQRGEIIFAISSLQPVNEASSVIKEFYFYFYIGAIILIIILSLIYSNMVSKPLIQLNNTAKKMASLNFSEKCIVNSEDEIGNLAATLNFLSYNLNEALTSLKDANIKLEEDIEKERQMEKVRKEFVAAVSHELKTPINLIGGYAEGLRDGIFEEGEKDYYIDVIIDESRKMGNLVADMLHLSHLESGTFKLVKEEFFIDELINSILKKFFAIIKDKKISLKIDIINGIKVYADWTRIDQVITNFTTNAIRHTEEGGTIIFGMKNVGDKILIFIENTGKKIPDEELDKVWDNFYKIDRSRNRKLGGTGIGLAIVKNILTLHGYEYGIENTEIGVRFYFLMNKN